MRIVDFHNHYYPPEYVEALQTSVSSVRVTYDADANPCVHYPGDYNILVPGHRDIEYRAETAVVAGDAEPFEGRLFRSQVSRTRGSVSRVIARTLGYSARASSSASQRLHHGFRSPDHVRSRKHTDFGLAGLFCVPRIGERSAIEDMFVAASLASCIESGGGEDDCASEVDRPILRRGSWEL